MAISAPLKITLYDPETNEEKKTFQRSFIPWRMLKKAVRLSKSFTDLNLDNVGDEDLDAIAGLVVDVFGDKFTVDELNQGADLGEMMAVIQAIVARAEGISSNPPPPGSKASKKR